MRTSLSVPVLTVHGELVGRSEAVVPLLDQENQAHVGQAALVDAAGGGCAGQDIDGADIALLKNGGAHGEGRDDRKGGDGQGSSNRKELHFVLDDG